MKIIRTIACLVISGCLLQVQAQIKLPVLNDSMFGTYYQQRKSLFELIPVKPGDVVFMGNSLTDGAEWHELFNDEKIKNRGISGDNSAGLLNRMNGIARQKPAKVFLLIGINDLAKGISTDSLIKNILMVAALLRQESPATGLYVQSILPVSDVFKKFNSHSGKTDSVLKANKLLAGAATDHGYTFINLYPAFCNEQGKLKEAFSNDGLHLLGEGYLLWKHLVYPYVYGLPEKPALIPLPRKLTPRQGYYPLYRTKSIVVNEKGLHHTAQVLKNILEEKGVPAAIRENAGEEKGLFEIRLKKDENLSDTPGSYHLSVTENTIQISAGTAQGIFYGIQTLRQLIRDGIMVDACEITDRPAYGWRGYMIDVGRNYMPVNLLKEQIDVMAQYKMNVFHFHATEDIAWRIAIDRYPQLTAPENMLRNKGLYYSKEEIRELIAYCDERFITFVPELDMPGHSAAFKRALKQDMQSDSGLALVKNILHEFCQTYPVPYIHIGADEVKVTNPSFIPEVTKLIESYGKKVIGWQPGGNFSSGTIRQLWMDDNARLSKEGKIRVIDSRHLYLNHMDPLEAVTTLFNRQIGDTTHETAQVMGGTLCMWHDRAVAVPMDILRMNPVYTGMLAFAERSWVGGGQKGWIANMSDGNEKAFAGFEDRLLAHGKQYFAGQPFHYVKQTQLRWKLFGPFNNEGDLKKNFAPENPAWVADSAKPAYEVSGGTIVLRHWWAPLIKGAIDQPAENTTWYAATRLWSSADTTARAWIGFNNLSRSPATDSPPANEWDEKFSRIWMNGKVIDPPNWKRPGQKGNSEIPLTDEGYEYRAPTQITLKKGWNTVMVKLPAGSFKGKDWQNPVKWMFTFVIPDWFFHNN